MLESWTLGSLWFDYRELVVTGAVPVGSTGQPASRSNTLSSHVVLMSCVAARAI